LWSSVILWWPGMFWCGENTWYCACQRAWCFSGNCGGFGTLSPKMADRCFTVIYVRVVRMQALTYRAVRAKFISMYRIGGQELTVQRGGRFLAVQEGRHKNT
jgi:hypothetical protein